MEVLWWLMNWHKNDTESTDCCTLKSTDRGEGCQAAVVSPTNGNAAMMAWLATTHPSIWRQPAASPLIVNGHTESKHTYIISFARVGISSPKWFFLFSWQHHHEHAFPCCLTPTMDWQTPVASGTYFECKLLTTVSKTHLLVKQTSISLQCFCCWQWTWGQWQRCYDMSGDNLSRHVWQKHIQYAYWQFNWLANCLSQALLCSPTFTVSWQTPLSSSSDSYNGTSA